MPLWYLLVQPWWSISSTTVRSRYPLWAHFSVHTSCTARSPWMISVLTFSHCGTPPMKSLTRIHVWNRLFLWIPILRSCPTQTIMWSLTHPSLPTLQWFVWLMICPSYAAPHQVPPPVRSRGFVHIGTVPHGRECARGGGCSDDTPGDFGNGYLPFDSWLG